MNFSFSFSFVFCLRKVYSFKFFLNIWSLHEKDKKYITQHSLRVVSNTHSLRAKLETCSNKPTLSSLLWTIFQNQFNLAVLATVTTLTIPPSLSYYYYIPNGCINNNNIKKADRLNIRPILTLLLLHTELFFKFDDFAIV